MKDLLNQSLNGGGRIPIQIKESLKECYIMCEAIEVMAAYLITKNITKEKAAIIRDLAKQCDSIYSNDKKYTSQLYENRIKLHYFLIKCTNNCFY